MDVWVEGIVKAFGSDAALRGVSLAVREGSLVALLGPSGSGKTTLLRVIAGLEIPDAGRIWLGGQDATYLPVQSRQVGFVFQHYALFRHLSVFENVAYGLRSRPRVTRPGRVEIARRVGELLDLVQLPSFAERRPAQLSGGQRQRVALARALAVEPRVLLLDEPFGALDAQVRKDLRRWMRDIHDRTGQTTIFVTHDQDEALELADEVAVLNAGRIEQVGTPAAIQSEPATAFVMSFVGTAARLPVSVEGGRPILNGRTLSGAIPAAPPGPGTLFCRPWELELVDPHGPEADLAGPVLRIRRVGPARRVEVAIEGGERVEVDARPDRDPAAGERIGVAIRAGRVFADGPVVAPPLSDPRS